MLPVSTGVSAALSAPLLLPAATVLAIDPTAVVDAPVWVRATASFLLVLAFGGAMLYLFEEFALDAIDASMERPLVSMVYGVLAQGTVVFLGVYALSQVGRVAPGSAAPDVAAVAIGVLMLVIAGVGMVVVGTQVAGAAGAEGPWQGLVVGAAITAVVWLLPSFALALVVWSVLVGVGIGGPAKNWLHASRSVESERDSS